MRRLPLAPYAAPMRLLSLALLLAACTAEPVPAQDRQAPLPARAVAVTFDDLPVTGGAQRLGPDPEAILALHDALLAHLDAHGVPATGFVNESRGNAVLETVLTRWLDAGHTLGNHSFSHPDINRIPLADYLEDVARGERLTRRLLRQRGDSLRYFRHPFLHAGDTPEKKAGLERFLADRGVRVAPVTIDNDEWIFAGAYARALAEGDMAMAQRIRTTYIDWFEGIFAHFEGWSLEVLGYEPPQILLLHANRLNADAFGALAAMMTARGYRFVSLDEAMTDPAYDQPDPYVGEYGLSWLHRWARGRGLEVQWEPDAPAWVDAYRRR